MIVSEVFVRIICKTLKHLNYLYKINVPIVCDRITYDPACIKLTRLNY